MGPCPVEPAAGRAEAELFLGGQDIGGDPSGDFIPGDRHKPGIAFQAAAEEMSGRIDGKMRHHLAELVAEMVPRHQEMVGAHQPAPHQQGIPGEDQAAGPGGPLRQLPVLDLREILYVAAEDPQPACQLAEHGIGDEARLFPAAQEITSGENPRRMVFSVTTRGSSNCGR
jgi:hypothetical protein